MADPPVEAPPREAHPSDAPPAYPTIRIKLGSPFDTTKMYTSPEVFVQAFQQFSVDKGYSIVVRSTNRYNKGSCITYECDRGGKPRNRKNKDLHPSRQRQSGSRKIDCPFRIELREQPLTGEWRVKYTEEYHNHEASDGASNHPANRTKTLNVNEKAEEVIRTLISRMTKVSTIRATMKKEWGVILTKRDIYNLRARIRNEQLGGLSAIQWLARELEEREFFVRMDTDEDNRVTRLFFAHPDSIKVWQKAPDVVLMDATYKTNRFGQPCVNICGSLGNNMTPQLAIGFLSGEDEVDYTWVLEAMKELIIQEDIDAPKLFITDREEALMNTLDNVFPDSDHILCHWHINMNVVANCKKHFEYQEDFEEFFQAWLNVIDATTEEMYEEKLTEFKKLNEKAVLYAVKTWLKLKEKLVGFTLPLI